MRGSSDEIEATTPAGAGAEPAAGGLSNDYLNHFSEVLMLIELAAGDPDAAADLADWRPIDYPAYFAASQLRRAPAARAAYDALAAERRVAFEALVAAMDRLATTAIRALRPPCGPQEAATVAEVTGPALRRLIAQASAFLNSGGVELPEEADVEAAQAAIDSLLERASAEA
ncbi:hypothetical protein [Salinarimonas sp.]|uniref:hypothetical protein n=1 Tax=Salinarimonas sp. TaxID=2766526 RepID=UPI0032D91CE0